MARLRHERKEHLLRSREVLGRHPTSTLILASPLASAVHALIAWSGDRWVLRDLGSTNGTWLNDARIAAGRDRPLTPHDVLAFGAPEERWEVLDLDPPTLRASSDGTVRHAQGGLLALPDDDHPELVFLRSHDGRWASEGGPPLQGPVEVMAGGRVWTVDPPDALDTTGGHTVRGWDLSAVNAVFRVSRDEEHVELTLAHGTERVDLAARAHTYLLLLLARARAQDEAAGLAPTEAGWMPVEDLCRQLRVTRAQLDLLIHRARRQAPAMLLQAPGGLIERRAGAGLVRFSVARPQGTGGPAGA